MSYNVGKMSHKPQSDTLSSPSLKLLLQLLHYKWYRYSWHETTTGDHQQTPVGPRQYPEHLYPCARGPWENVPK